MTTAFDTFRQALDNGRPRLRYDELEVLRTDKRRLWAEASKIACDQFKRIVQRRTFPITLDDMDALQNAIVSVGERLHLWDPERGALSTYIWPIVLREVAAYCHDQRTGGIGSPSVRVEQTELPGQENDHDEEGEELCVPMPEAMIDNTDLADVAHNAKLHEYARKRLNKADYDLLSMRLGLDGRQYAVNDIADMLSVDRRTIARRLESIQKCLKEAAE